MLRTDSVPCSHNAALQERECGFDGVCVNVTHNVNVAAVLNGLVSCSRNFSSFHGEGIRGEIIRENYIYILANILSDELCNGSGFNICGMEHAKFAIALTDTDYDFLFGSASGESIFLGTRLSLAADIGFIYLDLDVEHRLVDFHHRCADSVAEIPCCPIASDSERALHLASGHAFLGLAEKQDGDEPFIQRQMAVIENRSGCNSELVVAVFAVEQLLFGLKLYDWHFAAQTLRAFGPAQSDEQLAAFRISRKHGVYIN